MRRYLASLLAIIMVFSQTATGLVQTAYADAAATVFEAAGWNFSATPTAGTDSLAATSGEYKSASSMELYLKNTKIKAGTNRLYYGSSHMCSQGFDAGIDQSYWLFKTSSEGLENLEFSLSMRSSGTGPKDFDMQWSLDGATNWTHFGAGDGSKVFPIVNPDSTATVFKGALPAEAKNQKNLFIRVISKTNEKAKPSGAIASGGVNGVNGVSLKGTFIPGFAVSASPASGATVPLNAPISLSFSEPSAVIHYTVNGGAEQISSSNSVDAVIPAFDQTGDKAVVTAYATYGETKTKTMTFFYTQSTSDVVTSKPGVGAIDTSKPITLLCATPGSTIHYTLTTNVGNVNGTENVEAEANYTAPLTIDYAKFPIKLKVYATTPNYKDSAILDYGFTAKKPSGGEKNYYGQIHAHTAENSDGQGTLDEAYDYAKNSAKLDYMILTDHSNSFDLKPATDTAATYNLTTYNADNDKWKNGIAAATKYNEDNKFAAGYAYEMTWSGGPGHMNTFNTTGFVSRNNTILNNKTGDAGLKAYYELLKNTPGSISEFNHPGVTFGNFANFNYYDPIIDERINLLEVGNGEGAVGSGGYFRSIDQYILALDKGWHVAPTNNQDNHKKLWGDANTCRTVVYTNDLTLNGIYNAFNERAVWATENVNLDVVYTLNNEKLGTILEDVPATAKISVKAINKNPADATSTIKKVVLISNNGEVIDQVDYDNNDVTYEKTIDAPKPGYYFVEVIDAAGRYAVTAPVWLGSAVKVGVTSVVNSSVMPVTTEPLKLTTSFYNNEKTDALLKSVTYTVSTDPSANITATPNKTITANGGECADVFTYTPSVVGNTTVNISAVINVDGLDRTVISSINFKVADITKVVFCGIDGSHGGEYVSGGKYPASMGNMMTVAANNGVRVVQFATSQELINACSDPRYKTIILSAPSRSKAAAWPNQTNYTAEEISAIKAFAEAGNTLIFTTVADYQENGKVTPTDNLTHMSGLQNTVLSAIGSNLRIGDDEVLDDVKNGGSLYRLYLTEFNKSNPLLKGLVDGQVYSQYSGATIYVADNTTATTSGTGVAVSTIPSSVSPIVFGFPSTFSAECDVDNFGFPDKPAFTYVDFADPKAPTTIYKTDKGMNNPDLLIPKYDNGGNFEKLIAASETLTHANGSTSQVIVAGGVFMSNFEIQVSMENSTTLPYANTTIMNNLFAQMNPKVITSIKDVKKGNPGDEFTVIATATSDVYNGTDANNGFFDCIYAQDATGGINVFPVSKGVLKGQKLQITGTLDSYQGEIELKVSSVKVIDTAVNEIAPVELSTKEAMAPENVGMLVKTSGIVSDVVKDPTTGEIIQFEVNDGSGKALIFINGYITKGVKLTGIEPGANVSAIGLASVGESAGTSDFKSRLRVRDRAEIKVISAELPKTSMPTSELPEDTYTTIKEVVLKSETPDSIIYFTTDGSVPTSQSAIYVKPISLSDSTTIKAIAIAPEHRASDVATFAYTINLPQVESPQLTPAEDTYKTAIEVAMICKTENSTIYYTVDGSEPTTASNLYSAPFSLEGTTTVKAIAVATGYKNSDVVKMEYVIKIPGKTESPTASIEGGTYKAPVDVELKAATEGSVIYYTIDGTNPTVDSLVYSNAIRVEETTLIKAMAVAPGCNNSEVVSFSYTITIPVTEVVIAGVKASTYSETQLVELTCGTENSVIYYTLDGSDVTTGSAIYTSGIQIDSTTEIKAMAVANGCKPSPVTSFVYVIDIPKLEMVKMSVKPGRYPNQVDVGLLSDVKDAVVYYTVDGSEPTTASLVYNNPIHVEQTTVIKAIAVKAGHKNSDVATGEYVIYKPDPTPQPKPEKPEKEEKPNATTGNATSPSPSTPVVENKPAEVAKPSSKITEIEKTALAEKIKAQATSSNIEDRKQLKENVAILNASIGTIEAKSEVLANPETLSKAIATSVENLKKEFAATGLSEKTAKPVVTLESASDKISLSLQAADIKVAKANGADFKVATADASVKVANADLNADKAYKVAIEKDASLKGTAPKQMAAITEGVKLDTEFKAVQLAIPVDAAKAKTLGVFKLDEAKKTYVLVQSQIDSATGSLVVADATNGQYVVAEVKTAFADTSKTWAKDTIAQVSARRIMVGLADDKFAPEKTVTKAEFAAALLNVIGKADPNAKDWKASSVAAANQLGFGATFLNDKTADKAITREEMAYMMAKAYGFKAEFELQASSLNFKDAKNVNKALESEVAKAQQLGLVKGMADGNFKPASTGTRAEAAQMLLNLASNL